MNSTLGSVVPLAMFLNMSQYCHYFYENMDTLEDRGNRDQPVHVTRVLRPADLSVAVSVVVGKNLLMKEIELAKVSSEVGLVFVNC